MITEERITEELEKLCREEAELRVRHDQLVKEHNDRTARVNEMASNNIARMNAILGAKNQLKSLLNGETPTGENKHDNPANTGNRQS